MGLLIDFTAFSVTHAIIDRYAEPGASTLNITGPTNDPISSALNQVRFRCEGAAAVGDWALVLFTMRTSAHFRFQVPVRSNVTVHGHFTPNGTMAVAARTSGVFEGTETSVSCTLWRRLLVRVRNAQGQEIVSQRTPYVQIALAQAFGWATPRSDLVFVAVPLLELFSSLTLPEPVLPTQVILVTVRYLVQVIARDGTSFDLDFNSSPLGLNVPMVAVPFTEVS